MTAEKEKLRREIWESLKDNNLSNPLKSPYGRIPDFKGSDAAAETLRSTPEWMSAKTIFSSPDSAQKKVREFALKDKKLLIMATPKLKKGYLSIKPQNVKGEERDAATIKGAFKIGKSVETFPEVDLVVEGSVAVDMIGNRLERVEVMVIWK